MTKNKLLLLLALLMTAATGAMAADTYTVAGSNSAMFGSTWDPTYTANDMTKNGDGTYSITYTNVYLTENVKYKVVKNHSWDEAYPALDRVINIAEAGTYTLTIHFNPTTHEVYETMPANKFDITLKAANANTIEAGKATVTVGGTAATVTDGKLEGVKMGTEVKMTAKEGYKFRKVEVKKKAPAPVTVTWSPVDFNGSTYTQDGVTLTPSSNNAAWAVNFYDYGDNTFTTTLGKFTKIEIVCVRTNLDVDGWTKEKEGQYQPYPNEDPDYWENLYKMTWTGDAESVTIQEKAVYGIQSITFTIQ